MGGKVNQYQIWGKTITDLFCPTKLSRSSNWKNKLIDFKLRLGDNRPSMRKNFKIVRGRLIDSKFKRTKINLESARTLTTNTLRMIPETQGWEDSFKCWERKIRLWKRNFKNWEETIMQYLKSLRISWAK